VLTLTGLADRPGILRGAGPADPVPEQIHQIVTRQ